MNRITTIFSVFLLITCFQVGAFAKGDDVVIKEIQGFVQIQRLNESDWIKAEEDAILTSGDRVRSFLKSSALLVFPDSSEFRLRENTSLDIKDVSQNIKNKTAKRELKLNLGSLHYKVPPKKEKTSEFKIHSSTSIVGITGTEGIVTSKGDGKPSENILIEGSTYNTDDQGMNGRYQTKGNIYIHDGKSPQVFSAEVAQEAKERMAINEEHLNSIIEIVTVYKRKKDEGYHVDAIEIVIKQAFFFLEKRNYDLAKQMIQRADLLLESAQKIVMPKQIAKNISEILEAIKAKDSEGYDTSETYAIFENVRTLVQNGYFKEVDQEITSLQQKLALLVMRGEGTTFQAYYQKMQLKVLEKEEQGYAVGEIKSTLRQSQIFFDQEDKPKAFQILNNIEKRLVLTLRNISDALQKSIDHLEGEIALKKEGGYATKDLELRHDEAKVFIKEEDFLKARELVANIEARLLTLRKDVSVDWQLKINEIRNDTAYKKSMGYDLNKINGELGKLEEYQKQGDLVNLEALFTDIKTALENLKLPPGFEANLHAFVKDKKIKEDLGYDLREVDSLNDKIDASVTKGDIKSARLFLKKAQELLGAVSDEEPPKIQILSTLEQDGFVVIEGYASDNTKIRNVSVNYSLVNIAQDGKFTYRTVPTQSLKELSVRAEDINGNVSAPVVVEIEGQYKVEAVNGKISDARIAYSKDAFTVKGKFVAGGKVKIGDIETFCDSKGMFAVKIDPRRTPVGDSITVTGFNDGGADGDIVTLTIEDQWSPDVTITKLTYNDSFAPILDTHSLKYKESSVTVSGQVSLKQMVNIEGIVKDIGGEIDLLEVAGLGVDVRKNGAFNASIVLDPSDENLSVTVTAKDKAGNVTKKDIALDVVWNIPDITINAEQGYLTSSGEFVKDIIVRKDVSDIVVVLTNAQGETVAAKRLPIADVWPPELEIQDIRYEGSKIIIIGRTSTNATVVDINNTVFVDSIQAFANASFMLTADYPAQDIDVLLTATNIEGKVSEEVKLTIGPPKDTKAPKLYVSIPRYGAKIVSVEGFVEDDSQIKSLTINGISVQVSDQGHFSHEQDSKDLSSIEIIALDSVGNQAKEIIALKDNEPPQIVINTWEVKDGRLVISGEVTDNVAVKQVRLNNMPIAQGKGARLVFHYDGVLTENSKEAVIVAVDLLNNESREGPREIIIPTDATIPTGENIGIKYGSPIIYATGRVNDLAGVKAVYVNGKEVELFDNGSFHIKVSIDVGPPKLEFESLAYDNGKVIAAGKVALGEFSPAKIVVESEDLSGNRGVLFAQVVTPYELNKIEVIANGTVLDIGDDGSIRYEQPIIFGERTINIEAADPFDNRVALNLELESDVPFVNVNPLEYNSQDELVILTGEARDENSGLYSVTVNGIRIDFNPGDGSFSYTGSFDQRSLSVVATDNIGNVTSITKAVNPPDIWPPVFSLTVTPIPSIIGNPVFIEIISLDSHSYLPEILGGLPTVTANLNGSTLPLEVQGEGVNYIATLETTGLDPVLVTIEVSGSDEAGNNSTEVEGTNVFALVEEDSISPSFTFELNPSPMELGEESAISIFASEDLKESPTLVATLPSGTTNNLELASTGGGKYEASLIVPVEEGLGNVLLRLSGGEDLSGNTHDTSEEIFEVVAPVTESDLPLNIHLIEFLSNKFTISGQTASEAIVQMQVGEFLQNIIADAEGYFTFERQVLINELEELHRLGDNILVSLKAHNYAGFESPAQTFDVPLPPLPEAGGENFMIQLQPSPVGQGDTLNINIEILNPVTDPARGLLYLSDGTRIPVDLQGQNTLSAQYSVPEDAPLGPAIFEVVAGNVREGLNFDIVLSTEWMQRLNKEEFFSIHASPDPLLVGNEAFFVVETLGDIPDIPQMQIILPNGQAVNIPLQGGGRRFEGRYQSQASAAPGRAELVLNPGTPEEIRRPYGIEEQSSGDGQVDVYLFANPNPLFAGEPYDVNISLSQDIDFVPRLILRLADGRGIDVPLNGSVPSNRFNANGTLSNDVGSGLAQFVLLDDQGLVMDRFPAHVSAPISASAGLDIFVIPDIVQRFDNVTVQLNSVTSLPDGQVMAHIDYPDGSREIIPLSGNNFVRQGMFTVPDYVPTGVISISLFDARGGTLGTTRAQVVEEGHVGGLVDIYLDNPDFGPSETVRIGVEAGWPLNFIPQAKLIYDGGSVNIILRGRIPGNRFGGEFRTPAEPIENGRIEVMGDHGGMIGDFILDHRSEGEGDVIITPMPPVIGEPLSVRVVVPSTVNSAPTVRLIFEGAGPVELNSYGALPGNTFTASLNQLNDPLIMVEIIHDGNVVASIPVDHLTMRDLEFFVDTAGEIAPCELVDIFVRADGFVPFVPQISIDFQGRIVEVPLAQLSPSEFTGRLNIPCDASSDNVNIRVYDPQGMLLWQRLYTQNDTGQGLYLNVMPMGNTDVQLSWDLLRGIDSYEIRYGKTVALDQRIVNQGATSAYYLSTLDPGEMYFFQVAALKDGREIMASDIIQTTIGSTMRELYVYEHVDGTNVELIWTEYPGATKYRVAWGMTPGALANAFELDGLNYFVQNLTMGNMYYMKVFALDDGGVISESREIFVHLQAFQSQGGDIYITPDPPVQGQDLQISIHSYDDLSFIPNIVVHLQNGDVEMIETGFGRDFMAILPAAAFTSSIYAIDVYDSNGQHMFGRGLSGTSGGYGGAQVPMFITPDPPQIGYDLTVRVEFPDPVSFIPSLFIEFASETRQYALATLGNNRIFETVITGNTITSTVMKVWIEGPNGMYLGDRLFGSVSGGGSGFNPPNVWPDPPVVGQPFNVELDIGEIVSLPPILRIYFANGMQEISMFGTTPGQFFTYNIASLTSMITSIDFVDPLTNMIDHTWWPGSSTAVAQSCDILILSDDPPIFGQPIDMRVIFPQPLSFTPTLSVDFENGPRTYTFPQAPGLYIYEMALPIGEMNSKVLYLKVLDEFGGLMCERGFQASGVTVIAMSVTPDPPQIGQDLQVHVEFSESVGFTPRWRLFTISGPIEGDFSQGSGLSVYDQIIPGSLITLFPTDLEIVDDNNNDISGGELLFVNPANFTCTATFDPSPPMPYTNLTVTATYAAGNYPSYIPRLSMEFDLGGGYFQDFPQAAGQSFYSMTVQGSNITDNILIVGIGNPATGSIDCGADFEEESGSVDIILDLNPPVVNMALSVTANFLNPTPFVPRLRIEFDGAPDKLYIFPGSPGLVTYQYFVPVGDMGFPVTRVAIEDPQGIWIPNDIIFASQGANDVVITLDVDPPLVGTALTVTADFLYSPPFVPRLVLEFYGAPDKDYIFPGSPGQISYQHAVPVGDMEFPISRILVEDPGGAWIPNDRVFTAPSALDYPHSLFTTTTGVSGEIKIFWDSVTGATGYKIYYGTASQIYNESGSPLDVTDANATSAIISGLFDNTFYYITVESYDAISESNNPEEVSRFPGTGGGSITSAPTIISKSVSAGDNITQQTLTLTNNGTTSANMRFEASLLFKAGGDFISPSNYTITPVGPVNIAASASANFDINLSIPAGAVIGDYAGIIKFYDDANSNAFFDTGEAFTEVDVQIMVTAGGGTALAASPTTVVKSISQGTSDSQVVNITNNTGSAVDIRYQTLTVLNRDGGGGSIGIPSNFFINISEVTGVADGAQGAFTVNFNIPGGQAIGDYTTGTITFYADADGDDTFDVGESTVVVNLDINITAAAGVLAASPTTVVKSINQGAMTSQIVNITNNTGVTADLRYQTLTVLNRDGGGGSIGIPSNFFINISEVTGVADGAQGAFIVNFNIPGGQAIGSYNTGSITFYADADGDDTFDVGEETVIVSLLIDITTAVTVDHIHMSDGGVTSSQMGDPIFITLTAHDASHVKATSFQTDVNITVSESQVGEIPDSWHISTNGGPQGPANSSVAMFDGLGGFTVDSLEPGDLQITVTGIATQGGPINLEFTPNSSVSAVTRFAIIGPNTAPTDPSLGADIWIAAVDATGIVVTGYTGTVDFTVSGNGANTPVVLPTSRAFAAADQGQFLVTVRDNSVETVTLTATENPGSIVDSTPIDFVGVTQYLVFGEGSSPNFAGQGTTQKYTLRAADGSGNIVRAYNQAATFTRITDPTNDAFLSDGSAIQFVDGIAEIVLNNNQSPETIVFEVVEDIVTSIRTVNITADFQASDSAAPQIIRVEMDTPWIVHVYFDEDVDSATAGVEANYTGAGTVDKVCWYGDNVTLNLAAIPGALGDTFGLTINLVQDTIGNPMDNVFFAGVVIPNVDFQGVRGTIADWFEIQASNVNPVAGETVHITVFHKNVCGYLSGSNATNANSTVSSITINYAGESGRLDGNQPSSPTISDGRSDFDIIIAASPTSGSFTISATGGSPTVNTSQVLTINVP